MFEQQSYETILQRMLDQVPDSVDKREGSIIYDALAPAAAELAQSYIELDAVLDLGFALTTNGKYLDLRTQELGVYRKEATQTVRKATFNTAPGLGARFFIEEIYYVVTQDGTADALVQCETAGEIGDDPDSGSDLLPVETIEGLTTAELGDIVIPGSDTETDAQLLERYLLEITKRATSGNIYHYDKWAREVNGVGDVKVFPLWKENGTVKLVIVDDDKNKASDVLVAQVQAYIDPNANGDGSGEAPVGATVTVQSAEPKDIDVSVTLVLQTDKNVDNVRPLIETALQEYFKSIVFVENSMVQYTKIGELILNTEGVVDYIPDSLTINDEKSNIELLAEEIPVCGVVTLNA